MSSDLDRLAPKTTPQTAKTAIAEAISIAALKKIKDACETLRGYAAKAGEGRDKINDWAEPKVESEWKGGLLLREIERQPGTSSDDPMRFTPYQTALRDAELRPDMAHRWQAMSWLPEADLAAYFVKQRDKAMVITSEDVYRMGKKLMPHNTIEPAEVDGKYDVIVIDPPWPMQKIERDVRPNQAGFDYPTMTEDELAAFDVTGMAADDAHLFLWTTHKFLPMAERLLEAWGFRYVCAFVWHKPGGFQPIGLPQYNCEFALYARKGSPKFIDPTDFFCCFQAPRREHSRKPDEFYNTVRRVTNGRRLDIFSREPHEGFEQWGNQVSHFAETV